MTLCIAAGSRYEKAPCVVAAADRRVETDSAGADTAFKAQDLTPGWAALLAGDLSNAFELCATFRTVLAGVTLDEDNLFAEFNRVSSAHKEILAKRVVQQALGMSYERFLTQGERELTPEIRTRVLYRIEQIEFDCDVIVCGFIPEKTWPYVMKFHSNGEVSYDQSFAAIGTGSTVAGASLYQRAQAWSTPFNEARYNVYEAMLMAHKSNAPGVGLTSHLMVIRPGESPDREAEVTLVDDKYRFALHECFEKFGPKDVKASQLPQVRLEDHNAIAL